MSNIGEIFGGEFDANAQEAPASFDPFPVGVYTFTVASAAMKHTKDGTGQYVSCELTVTGPTHEGRKVFCNFNLQNRSAEAERIGQQQFGALCRAVGLSRIKDTDELIGTEFSAKVRIRPAKDGYAAQNEIQPETCAPLAGAPTAPPAPATSAAKPAPWAKKVA